MTEEFEYNDQEKEFINNLKDKDAPGYLEDRVVQSLIQRKLISKTINTRLVITGIAASLLFFIFGYLLGNNMSSSTGTNPLSRATYMLLLHEDANFQPSKDNNEVVAEYIGWLQQVRSQGLYIDGEELVRDGYISTLEPEPRFEPLTESNISGFFLLEADSPGKVQSLISNMPHLKYGGQIEIRKLVRR